MYYESQWSNLLTLNTYRASASPIRRSPRQSANGSLALVSYRIDIVDGLNSKTVAAVLFMFFATFASTVALGDVAERETEGKVGISE